MNKSLLEFLRYPEGMGVGNRFLYPLNCFIDKKRMETLDCTKFNLNKAKRKHKIIFSLTSFPERIDTVHYTLRSLFSQTIKPDRIILWLAESQFPNHQLPSSLVDLTKQGLEVKYCEDLMGYKRYFYIYPELKEDELLILFDDDIMFPAHAVERILNTYYKHPGCIVCDRGQTITAYPDGSVNPPSEWEVVSDEGVYEPSYRILASPGGGCLLFKGALFTDVLDVEIVKKYIRVGDMFLMFMALMKGTKIIKTEKYHRLFTLVDRNQPTQMGKDAIFKGHYLNAFQRLINEYPEAFKKLIGSDS